MGHADSASGAARPATEGPGRTAAVVTVLAVTALGLALRVVLAGDGVFADELSTYWIVTAHGLGGVLSTVHTDAEISPPLFFALSWLATQAGHAAELVRLPSLVAGVATIPLVHRLGTQTAGRRAALVAAALTAFSPFMAYYSAEARGYALMMAFVVLSTVAMLAAVETGRARWWAVHALAVCGAAYSHYTCVFVLGAQLAWLLWACPGARRPALLATGAAAVGFLPWATGFVADLNSPTSAILSALSPFTPGDVRIALEHWSVGYPYATLPLRDLPGVPALVLLGSALVLAAVGLVVRARDGALRPAWRERHARLVLVALLALATPVGEALASAVSTNLFGTRNLAASWPYLGLALAAVLVAAGPRLGAAAAGLAVLAFGLGAARMLQGVNQRPDYAGAATIVERETAPRGVVVDATGILSPGPLTGFDLVRPAGRRVLRAGVPAERDHPFTPFDPIVTSRAASARAVATARGGRVVLVRYAIRRETGIEARAAALRARRLPAPYRIVRRHVLPSRVGGLIVEVWERPGG